MVRKEKFVEVTNKKNMVSQFCQRSKHKKKCMAIF